MNNEFAYEGCKMSLLTCSRTLTSVDGMEVTTKLFWAISELQKAIIYAMLFNKESWKIEKDTSKDETHNLPKSIEASKDMSDLAPFVKQYINGEEEKKKIDEIQEIRNYVNHANGKSLEKFNKQDCTYLVTLIGVALNTLVEVVQCNEHLMKNDLASRMRKFVESQKKQLSSSIHHFSV